MDMIRIEIVGRFLLILGGINYLFDVNLFKYVKYPLLTKIINLLIGISALYFITNRDYYLPFLGKTVVPLVVPREKLPKVLTKVKLEKLPPNTSVVYWASSGDKEHYDNPMEAYGDYLNSGVSKTNNSGSVVVELECPSTYNVPKLGKFNKTLQRHIHYRFILPESSGMLSRVYTKMLNEKCQ